MRGIKVLAIAGVALALGAMPVLAQVVFLPIGLVNKIHGKARFKF